MARVTVVAQIAFVLSWLVAGFWQGARYSVLSDSISDMYAVTAPRGGFLVIVFTLCGAATIAFAGLSVWPSLRAGGWRTAVGGALLGLSIFGVGDLLSPFERLGCRMADSGCTPSAQLANSGGMLDASLSGVGILISIAAAFFFGSALRRTPGWRDWAWPARLVGIALVVILAADAAAQTLGLSLGGLLERLLAATGAAAIGVFAWRLSSWTPN